MVAGHYLAPKLTGRDLHPIEAYLCGCILGILLPFLAWCALWPHVSARPMPPLLPSVALLVIMAGAGAGTALAWAADTWAGARAEARARRRLDSLQVHHGDALLTPSVRTGAERHRYDEPQP
jgi:hypothetical protein